MKKTPDYRDALARLVALPSVSTTREALDMSNGPVIDELASWFESLGFDIEIQTISQNPRKANLIARYAYTDRIIEDSARQGLVLSGHTDTVPFDESLWQSSPFTLMERDNRLYGLGSTDMKGFFPVVLQSLKNLDLSKFDAPLTIIATADEESTMRGARALSTGSIQGRFAVIGEPTDLQPVRMHKGMMMESVRVTGQAGHSSNPALGASALDGMYQVMGALIDFRSQMQQRYRNTHFVVDVPTMNFGCIHGGDSHNRICGQCQLHFDLRPLPGMDVFDLQHALDRHLSSLDLNSRLQVERISELDPLQPFEQDENSELVGLAESLTGKKAISVAFATEAPFLKQLGFETLILGPGSINQAHQANEYIELGQINPAIELFTRLIRHFCYSKV